MYVMEWISVPFPSEYIDILPPNGMVSRGKSLVGKLTKSLECDPQEWGEYPHERDPEELLIFFHHMTIWKHDPAIGKRVPTGAQ